MHSFVKVLYFLSESVQIKIIADVVLVDLHEKLVTFKVAEPRDPPSARLTVIIIVKIVYKNAPKSAYLSARLGHLRCWLFYIIWSLSGFVFFASSREQPFLIIN